MGIKDRCCLPTDKTNLLLQVCKVPFRPHLGFLFSPLYRLLSHPSRLPNQTGEKDFIRTCYNKDDGHMCKMIWAIRHAKNVEALRPFAEIHGEAEYLSRDCDYGYRLVECAVNKEEEAF